MILKDSRTALVAETTLMVKGRPTPVIYKRFNPKKTLETVLNLVRPSRAGRAWQAAQHLKSRGLPTPQNLAYVVKTGRGPLGTMAHRAGVSGHDQGRAVDHAGLTT